MSNLEEHDAEQAQITREWMEQDESERFTFVAEWTIDIDSAEGPVDAAIQAFAHMQRPGTSANVFTIIDGLGNRFKVDLSEHEPEPVDL